MYLGQYGLSAQPFQLTPDPRFWFESATHKKAMAYLGYGLQQGEGFIVITGEIGAGKTTLVAHLLDRLDPARVNAVSIAPSHLGGDDLLRLVAQACGLPVHAMEKPVLMAQVEAFFMDRARAGQRNLLVVDEAQNLPIDALEELRMLSNLQSGGRALLQILILGQSEFRATLNSPALEQLKQRVIASHHLTGMDAAELGAYLDHRMALVGWQGRPAFAPDAVAALHQVTQGIPRRVNTLATQALLMAAMEQAQIIDRRIIATVATEVASSEAAPAMAAAQTAAVGDPLALDAAARLSVLEAQVSEQDAALRRVLSLLVEWFEGEQAQGRNPFLAQVPAA